ncbi:hypothetical protein AB0O32_13685 [Streptomyces rubiginosohelvolus]|uniref:hypothetical protein n=1 Tax=Streptomyces rubiginosohelvolus TaxID=67362 RepID=UPI00342CFDBF
MTGCDSGPTDSAPAPGPSATGPAPRGGPPTGSASRSLWTLIGEKGATVKHLPDDDPDVTAVRRTVALHSGVADNRDAATIEASTREELAYLSEEFRKLLERERYAPSLTGLFRQNALATRQTKIAWYRSVVHEDRKNAKVEMDSVIEFTKARPSYLEKGGFTLQTPYTQHRTISLIKRNGHWQISAIEKTPLTKPEARPDGS